MPSGFMGRGIGPTAVGGAGLVAPVPVAGAELVVNGNMELDANWNNDTSPTTNERSSAQAHGGTYSRRIVTADGVRGCNQSIALPIAWLQYSAWIYRHSGVQCYANVIGNNGVENVLAFAAGSVGVWEQFLTTSRALTTGSAALVRFRSLNGATEFFVDDVSIRPITLSSLFSSRSYASPNCDLSVGVTRAVYTQAGLVARLDSAASPANFIIAYLDGAGNVKVDKCVAGTYTNIISGAVTYAAGRVLRLVCSGTDVSAYYDGAQVGTTQTVADAGIVSNTRHGKFSTYASNTFTGYVAT